MKNSIDKNEVIKFFDRLAPSWDDNLIRNDEVITKILDTAKVGEGNTILDVACGTGVLFPYYIARNVKSVTGVDISPNMIKAARKNFPDCPSITLLCQDVEEMPYNQLYDAVIVYNALPHFEDPKRLIKNLAARTTPGGTLTIAHGMSLKKVNEHHLGTSGTVSMGLMPANDLMKLFPENFTQITVISDDSMYLVAGVCSSQEGLEYHNGALKI